MLNHLLQYVSAENLFTKKDRLLVAVSGGLDSSVLVHLLAEGGFRFYIAHCNFSLRGAESDADESFVKEMAKRMGVPFVSVQFDTRKVAAAEKTSIEETARNLRYRWFEEIRQQTDHAASVVATAHHADDNAETAAMNFFRGTGIKGLRGMLPKQGNVVRPLLFARRRQLEEYAQLHTIDFVTDNSNAENNYTRNYFRNVVIPAVEKVFPQAVENVAANIIRLREADTVYNAVMEKEKRKVLLHEGETVQIPVSSILRSKIGAGLLYEVIKAYGFSSAQLDEAKKLLLAQTGKFILSRTHRILRNRERLIISALEKAADDFVLIESPESFPVHFGGGILRVDALKTETIDPSPSKASLSAKQVEFPLVLRRWRKADYFYPLGMKKKKKISRFLTDKKLSLLEKENVWILESNKRILWVVGHRIDDRFKLNTPHEEVLQLTLLPSEKTRVL